MKIEFRQFIYFMVITGLAASAATSYASVQHPSYPATEEGPSQEVISSAPGYRGQADEQPVNPTAIATEEPAAAEASQIPQRLPAPPQPQAQSEVVVVAAAPAPVASAAAEAPVRIQASYDSVPVSQVEPLIRRLRIVEALVQKYGRAYDYRELTVTQLAAVLGQLDTETSQDAELRRRTESRIELKKEVRQEEDAAAAPSTNSEADSIGSAAPAEYIPAPAP